MRRVFARPRQRPSLPRRGSADSQVEVRETVLDFRKLSDLPVVQGNGRQ